MQSTLKRVRHEKVGAQVFEQLKKQILRRVGLPGSRMPSEHELSATLGVSRISVREALRMLASLALVQKRQGDPQSDPREGERGHQGHPGCFIWRKSSAPSARRTGSRTIAGSWMPSNAATGRWSRTSWRSTWFERSSG